MNADEIIPELNAPVRKAKARYGFECVLCNRQDLARYSDRAGLLEVAKNVRDCGVSAYCLSKGDYCEVRSDIFLVNTILNSRLNDEEAGPMASG